jgi:hypothetical protein
MQQIIESFIDNYSLTKAEVIAEIETAFSAMLSKWYRLEVMVFFREDLQLEAVAYNHAGRITMQQSVDFFAMKGRKTIIRQTSS